MARVHEGDAHAFEVVFERHANAAFSLAYRMCGRRAVAEDIVQEAFLSLWRSGARYDRARGSVRSWVLRVVHNRAIDAFRREQATVSRDIRDEGISETLPARDQTEAEVERRSDARVVRSALESLPPDQRKVIELAVLRRVLAYADRRDPRSPPRHGQGPHAARAEQALGDPSGVAL